MECPGGETACEMRNYNGKTPPELAESSGFVKLSSTLRSFVVRDTEFRFLINLTD